MRWNSWSELYLSNLNFSILNNVHFVASSIFGDDFSTGSILSFLHSINQLVELVLAQSPHESIWEEGIGDTFLFGNIFGDHNKLWGGNDFSVVGFGGDGVSNCSTCIESLGNDLKGGTFLECLTLICLSFSFSTACIFFECVASCSSISRLRLSSSFLSSAIWLSLFYGFLNHHNY